MILLCGGIFMTACGKETENVYVGIEVLNSTEVSLQNTVTVRGQYKKDDIFETYTKAQNNVRVNENSLITLSATPASGYVFVCWMIDDDIYSENPTIEINEEQSDEFVAYFAKGESASVEFFVNGRLKELPLVVVNGTISASLSGFTVTNSLPTFSGWLFNTSLTVDQMLDESFTIPNGQLRSQTRPVVYTAKA